MADLQTKFLDDPSITQLANEPSPDVLLRSGRELLTLPLTQLAKTSDLTGKVDKVAGKDLSTNDYTAAEKTKLQGIAAGATANITDAASAALMDSKDASLASTLRGGVDPAGDNLNKLYTLFQTLGSAGPANIPTPYGLIYSKASWSNLTDFTPNGGTLTLSGNKIVVSGGAGSFTKSVDLNYVTGLEKFKTTIYFKILTAPSGSSYGIANGVRSINAYGYSNAIGRVTLHTDTGNGGQVFLDIGDSYTEAQTSAANIVSRNLNDILRLTLELDGNVITTKVQNVTQGSAEVLLSYTYTQGAPYMPNAAKFAINIFGAEGYEIQLWNIRSNELKNASCMFIGDSKTKGYGASVFTNRFYSKLKSDYPNIAINAGAFDRTTEVLAKVPEIIAFTPKRVVLNIGSNDKRNNATLSAWSANYSNIVTQLTNAGIDVYHLLQFDEPGLTFADYNSYLTATYASNRIIDAGSVAVSGDNIHPSDLGHLQIYLAIKAAMGGVL